MNREASSTKNMTRKVRAAVKAVIVKNNQLLCLVKENTDGIYYTLPGGGQHHGETMKEALVRECMEEIGAEVLPRKVLFVREYIGKNHEFKFKDSGFHQVEVLFESQLRNELAQPASGQSPDHFQIGVAWVSFEQLEVAKFYPKQLLPYLQLREDQRPIYLGDIN